MAGSETVGREGTPAFHKDGDEEKGNPRRSSLCTPGVCPRATAKFGEDDSKFEAYFGKQKSAIRCMNPSYRNVGKRDGSLQDDAQNHHLQG